MAIDQRYTKWVKKAGQRGYVIDTRTGKRVTGAVKLVADTTKGKAGEVQKYRKGVGGKVKPAAEGGGVRPGQKPKPASRPAAPSRAAAPARPAAPSGGSQRQRPAVSAAERAKMGKGRKNWSDGARRTPSASGTANAAPSRSSTPSMSGRASAGAGRRAGGSASARVVSPASVQGAAANVRRAGQSAGRTAGSVAGFYAGMGKQAAAALLARYERGAAKLTAAQRAALQRIVKGY